MPIYDRWCESCDWKRADVFEPIVTGIVRCPNGHITERGYLRGTRSAVVQGDDPFVGGKTFENLGHHPVTVYSRAEYKRELQARGLQEFVRHAPIPGTDKSPHTSRWVSMDQQTLDNARVLLERVTG